MQDSSADSSNFVPPAPQGAPDDSPGEPSIDLASDAFFMGEALRQAERARRADEVPVGAVIVRQGSIIGRAWNQVESLRDATAHAEMLALTQAQSAVGDWRLTECDLYVTKGTVPHVRRGDCALPGPQSDLRVLGSQGRCGGRSS